MANNTGVFFNINDNDGIPLVGVSTDGRVFLDPFYGNVGVGTTNPSSKLHVSGGAYVSGNLGIGTDNPSEKLSVYGAVESLYDTIGEGGQFILRGKTGTPIRWNIDNYSIGGVATNLFRIFKEDNSTAGANGRVYVGITTIGEFIIGDGAGGLSPTGTANQQLQVQSGAYVSGNLGIGTTIPGAKLNVVDNSSSDALRITQTGSGNALVVEDSTNPDSTPVVISATGRIGIGTINPTNARYNSAYTQLVVSGDSSSLRNGITIDAYTTPGIVFQGRFFEAESSTRGYLFYYPFNSNTYSLDDSQQITGRGFVISPSERNVVAITSSFLATSSNINVGIGTTNPTEKLDVNGNVKLTGSIYGPSELIIDPAAVGDNTGSVRIKGNLYVDGTQTILNSTTIELGEFNVGIATTVGTNALLDGAGIGIGSTGIRKTLTYANTPSDSLKSSENFDLASGKVYKIDGTSVLSSTKLGSSIVNSSLTSVGTLTNLIVTGVTTSGGYNATTGNEYKINGTSVLTSTTLGSNVVNSSLTSVGTLGQLNVSGVSTLGVTTATNVTLQQLNVSGVSTLGVTTATNLTLQQLNVSGVSTLGITTATNVTLQQLNVSGVSTLGVTTATNVTLQQLNVSGVSTFAGITTVTGTTLFSKQLNVSGVSTLGGNVSVAGSIFPSTDATYDLGSLSLRWRNVYTTDLQLSNEGSQNEVDNTWGKWTIQEGEENLFIINRRTGKKYKFLLEEVN
jgi:hypothetical protein